MSDLYKMVMSLKKAADDLEVKKRELSMKITEMKSSTTFFCLPMRSPDKSFLVLTTTSSNARHLRQRAFVNEILKRAKRIALNINTSIF